MVSKSGAFFFCTLCKRSQKMYVCLATVFPLSSFSTEKRMEQQSEDQHFKIITVVL